MPELPDVTVYVEALTRHLVGKRLLAARLASPFLLRTVDPSLADAHTLAVREVRRLGKRIVIGLEGDMFLVLHLMIAGRLRWKPFGAALKGRSDLAAFDFAAAEGSAAGTLVFTEAGSKKRASLHVLRGETALAAMDAGGIEPLDVDAAAFAAALRRENHTLKRALTDPRILAGIGNAYSDEILHRARLSPMLLTQKADDETLARLHAATHDVLLEWTERLRADAADGFPKQVTAFREGMAVHGRFGEPCPVCGTAVQRIVRGAHESNYCPRCQTGGKMLADRALSRLLHDDWPERIEEWEERIGDAGSRDDARAGRRRK